MGLPFPNAPKQAAALWTRYDVAAYYRRGAVDLTLKVNNVFDTAHFIGGYGETTVIPGWPRTLSLRAGYTF